MARPLLASKHNAGCPLTKNVFLIYFYSKNEDFIVEIKICKDTIFFYYEEWGRLLF